MLCEVLCWHVLILCVCVCARRAPPLAQGVLQHPAAEHVTCLLHATSVRDLSRMQVRALSWPVAEIVPHFCRCQRSADDLQTEACIEAAGRGRREEAWTPRLS